VEIFIKAEEGDNRTMSTQATSYSYSSTTPYMINRNYFDLCALSVGYQKCKVDSTRSDHKVFSYVKGSKIFQCTHANGKLDYHEVYAKTGRNDWTLLTTDSEVFEYMYRTHVQQQRMHEIQADSGKK
jgi:hypothetical protein